LGSNLNAVLTASAGRKGLLPNVSVELPIVILVGVLATLKNLLTYVPKASPVRIDTPGVVSESAEFVGLNWISIAPKLRSPL
jgi:hypothetical protein